MNEKKIKQKIPMSFNLDDFYTTQEQRDEAAKEKIEDIEISLIDDFKEHPFKVLDNDELKSLENSIKNSGVMEAVILNVAKILFKLKGFITNRLMNFLIMLQKYLSIIIYYTKDTKNMVKKNVYIFLEN